MCELVAVCARLQTALFGHRDALVSAGVPDLAPELLPDLVQQQLAEAAGMPPDHLLHLDAERRADVRARMPLLGEQPDILSESGLPSTLDHNDLHLGNAFGSDPGPDLGTDLGTDRADDSAEAGPPRLFDFGDCVLAHPFTLLRVPLPLAIENSCVARDLDRICDAYLEQWALPQPRAEQLRWLDAAGRVSGVGRWEVWRRLVRDVPAAVVAPYHPYVADLLTTLGDPIRELRHA